MKPHWCNLTHWTIFNSTKSYKWHWSLGNLNMTNKQNNKLPSLVDICLFVVWTWSQCDPSIKNCIRWKKQCWWACRTYFVRKVHFLCLFDIICHYRVCIFPTKRAWIISYTLSLIWLFIFFQISIHWNFYLHENLCLPSLPMNFFNHDYWQWIWQVIRNMKL